MGRFPSSVRGAGAGGGGGSDWWTVWARQGTARKNKSVIDNENCDATSNLSGESAHLISKNYTSEDCLESRLLEIIRRRANAQKKARAAALA
jgi:hypothetical protein